MDKRVVFVLLFAVFLLPLIASAPPVTTVQQFTEGLVVEYPSMDFIKQGQDFDFHFHVFNVSTGGNLTTNINCSFHLYNSSGNHVLELFDSTASHTFDFSFLVKGGNFTNSGIYYYITQCQTGLYGGYAERAFEVNSVGRELEISTSVLYISLFIILGFFIFVVFFIINKLPESNERDEEGKIMSINYLKYLRSTLWFVEWILVVAVVYLASNLAFAFSGEELFAEILFVLFRICLGITPIIVIVWIAYMFVSFFHDRQFQNLLNRGFFEQGGRY